MTSHDHFAYFYNLLHTVYLYAVTFELHFHTQTHTLEKNWIIGVIRWKLNPC